MEKVFNELESFDIYEQDSAKQKIAECFALTKDPWIAYGLIDYYGQTNSYRIVEVLVKVQNPHDVNIFNKLSKCLADRESTINRTTALTLFGHIVRKHPTWLHKVVNHPFMKDLLKLLKGEKDVITFISGLMCIISLLPIIPTSIGIFLIDLFEVFNHLATWTAQPTNLEECQLIHLQYGLYTLFNRLYGMYPCNFVAFLRQEFVFKQDKMVIFNHVVRPLLDTVRIHPQLITASKDQETNISKWRKMEPHDVVVECAKYSIESDRPSIKSSNFLDYPVYMSSMKPLEYTHLTVDLPPLPPKLASAKSVENKFESLWSPSLIVQATPPPPTGTVPNTPTPTPVPIMPNFNVQMGNSNNQNDGTSPPLIEAAVEATPETTPMKPDIKAIFRPYPTNSQTARAISFRPATISSQPSSPMKKDPQQQFQYNPTDLHQQSQFNLELASNHKLMRILSDRQQQSVNESHLHDEFTSPPLTIISKHHKYDSPSLVAANIESMLIDSSREDQEVNDINYQNTSNDNGIGLSHTDLIPQDIELDELEVETEEEDDQDTTPPLCNNAIYQSVDYVRRVKRLRMYSHCMYSAGTSPAETISYMSRAGSIVHRLKRHNSWPNLSTGDVVINSSKSKTDDDVNGNEQKHPSSSPSDEAISAVSHFKKSEQSPMNNVTNTQQNNDTNFFKKIREDMKTKPLEVKKINTSTQTVQYWPQAYEAMFYNMFSDELKRNQSNDMMISNTTTSTTTTTTTTIASPLQQTLSPHEMLDQYIQVSLKRKNSSDYRDHIELLAIQLQFEKHRREIHAERNRRLLGKSRNIRGLEQSNQTLSDQVARLSTGITNLTKKSTETRNSHQAQLSKLLEEHQSLQLKYNEEIDLNKSLKRQNDSLEFRLAEEQKLKRASHQQNDILKAEIFDLKHLLELSNVEAKKGRAHRDQLVKLQSEIIIFNDARIECARKMEELDNIRARDAEADFITQSYIKELTEVKRILDMKTAELDYCRSKISDLESQVQRRDSSFTDSKRLLKTLKDEYEEKCQALEQKYSVQKAIIVKMEEHILELTKNNAAVVSPESEKTDFIGSLGYTSPLSMSLASSDGISLSASLRSSNDLKNIHSLINPDGTHQLLEKTNPVNITNDPAGNQSAHVFPKQMTKGSAVSGRNKSTTSDDEMMGGGSGIASASNQYLYHKK